MFKTVSFSQWSGMIESYTRKAADRTFQFQWNMVDEKTASTRPFSVKIEVSEITFNLPFTCLFYLDQNFFWKVCLRSSKREIQQSNFKFLMTLTTGSPNCVGFRWDFECILECMKINKLCPEFKFFYKNRIKNYSPCDFVLLFTVSSLLELFGSCFIDV